MKAPAESINVKEIPSDTSGLPEEMQQRIRDFLAKLASRKEQQQCVKNSPNSF
jgi:ABC-type phosphate/phosphonate transport system substrate-binding protein